MLSLEPALHEHLRSGGTLAVSSRQRAAAVQIAYAAARLAAGEQTWASPDVLPLGALLARESANRLLVNGQRRRQLTPVEEWMLWRRAAIEAGARLELLSVNALLQGLRSNHQLLAEWGIEQGILATPEGEWLLRTRQRYQLRRESLQALDSDAWRGDGHVLAGRVVLAHPDECGAATRRILLARGASLYQVPTGARAAAGQVVTASNTDAELEQMANWARTRLEQDPAARLLLVVPGLSRKISEIQRVLDENLHEGFVAGQTEESTGNYAIEGGTPLADAPLVSSALLAGRLAAGRQPFAAVASLLRSPCLGGQHAAARLELELAARRQGLMEAGWQELAVFASDGQLAGHDWFVGVAGSVLGWSDLRVLPSRWAVLLAELWARLGWPGDATMDSAEQQRRQRFDELVGEFASLDEALGEVAAGEALDALAAWVTEARFEPASGDAPVTVTGRLEDPLVHYDGIWVAGMTAEAWPPPAELSGFVAASALRQAGNPRASADGQLALAQRCMQQWSQRTPCLVYSWAQIDGEAEAGPSPLLAGLAPLGLPSPQSLPDRGLLQPAAVLESCAADQARPWPADLRAPGGVGLLQAQSHCPFKASARARLGCEALPVPVAGVGAQLHGEIVHAALRQLWSEIGGSESLHARTATGWSERVRPAVRRAIDAARAGKGRCVDALAWEVEQERCEQLLRADLEAEALRPPFVVVAGEQAATLQLGTLQLGVRLDRVDALVATDPAAPARQVLIDYKTGKPESVDFNASRPKQLQLQAYAQLVGNLRAAVTLHLHRGEAKWAGVVVDGDAIAGIKPQALAWPELQQRWCAMLSTLGQEFVNGVATVDPLKNVCQQCELQLLCRVDAEMLEDELVGGDGDGEAADD